jgi:hypothetical protein
MPRPRRQDTVRLLMRSSGWEAKKRESQNSEQAAQFVISSFPAPHPPSSPAVPIPPTAGPGAIAARQSPRLAAALLPHLPEVRGSEGAGDADLRAAERSLATGSDAKPHRWPATIALLPDGRISGSLMRSSRSLTLTPGASVAVCFPIAPSVGLAAAHDAGSCMQDTCSWVTANALA